MVCPLVKLQASDQPERAVVPVFLMVMVAPKALLFCGEIVYTTLHPVEAWAAGAKRVMRRAASAVMYPLNR